MGSTTSKAARTAASTSIRKYPKRDPTHTPPPTNEPSISPPPHQATSSPPNPSNSPTLLSTLRTLGPVTPINPYTPPSPSQSPHTPPFFPDPASSPSILLLTARERIRVAAEAEFSSPSRSSMAGGGGEIGRRFLDVGAIQRVLVLRDEKGVGEEEIERVMGLGRGVVGGLGGRGVVQGV